MTANTDSTANTANTEWTRIDKSDLEAVVSALDEKWDVFAPVRRGESDLRLRRIPSEGEVVFRPEKPLLSLKTLFLPEVEELFAFGGKSTEPSIEPAEPMTRERVVLSALGCDMAALEILDRVFLEKPVDELYRERREGTTLVGLVCTGQGQECFCASAGVDPLRPPGADALVADMGEAILLKALTEKGRRIAEALRTFVDKPTKKELSRLTSLDSSSRQGVSLDAVSGKKATELWNHRVWEELEPLCLGCGLCTLVCPTCHCFDVEDERCGSSGGRFRAWDSCMSSCFTKMAGGDNPRPTGRERVRQRFLHKLSYFPSNSGLIACVGCGRCTVVCPVGIGIEEVVSKLAAVRRRIG